MHKKTTLLNEGSSSHVYLTEDPKFVMKEYKSFYPQSSRYKEVQILELLKRQCVVSLIEHTSSYLILERLQNEDLFEIVQKHQLNTHQIKEICKTLIRIIHEIHSTQIVHRDIKLENILINNEGKLVICDFGFAEILTSQQVKRTVGTQSYMAPELHTDTIFGSTNSENINAQLLIKSDIFSLGVTLFQLILGFMPFQTTKPSAKCKLWRLIQQKKWSQYWMLIQKLSKNQIEKDVQDFLESFLQSDSQNRTTLMASYNHPFLQDVKDDVQIII